MSYQDLPTDEHFKDADNLWGVCESIPGLEVKEATVADWLRATVGMHMDVKHVRGEKVVALRAAPEEWELCA